MAQIAILLISLWAGSSTAASFDCVNALSKMEKAICGNAQLSKLDEDLAAEYKKARVKISPASNSVLITSQRSWLRFISAYCFFDTTASPASALEATNCLVRAYQDRIEDLAKTGGTVGRYKKFTAIDHHIRILKDQQAVHSIERKFTQVDDETFAGKNLNNYLRINENLILQDERGTESYDVELTQISPDWLYKQIKRDIFTGAYPTSGTECGLYSMSQNRPLRISDLFKNNTWQVAFGAEAKKHFLNLAKTDKDFDITLVNNINPSHLQSSSFFNYCLNNNGIELYGFLPHVMRASDGVTVGWQSLRLVLTPYAKEQIKKLGGL